MSCIREDKNMKYGITTLFVPLILSLMQSENSSVIWFVRAYAQPKYYPSSALISYRSSTSSSLCNIQETPVSGTFKTRGKFTLHALKAFDDVSAEGKASLKGTEPSHATTHYAGGNVFDTSNPIKISKETKKGSNEKPQASFAALDGIEDIFTQVEAALKEADAATITSKDGIAVENISAEKAQFGRESNILPKTGGKALDGVDDIIAEAEAALKEAEAVTGIPNENSQLKREPYPQPKSGEDHLGGGDTIVSRSGTLPDKAKTATRFSVGRSKHDREVIPFSHTGDNTFGGAVRNPGKAEDVPKETITATGSFKEKTYPDQPDARSKTETDVLEGFDDVVAQAEAALMEAEAAMTFSNKKSQLDVEFTSQLKGQGKGLELGEKENLVDKVVRSTFEGASKIVEGAITGAMDNIKSIPGKVQSELQNKAQETAKDISNIPSKIQDAASNQAEKTAKEMKTKYEEAVDGTKKEISSIPTKVKDAAKDAVVKAGEDLKSAPVIKEVGMLHKQIREMSENISGSFSGGVDFFPVKGLTKKRTEKRVDIATAYSKGGFAEPKVIQSKREDAPWAKLRSGATNSLKPEANLVSKKSSKEKATGRDISDSKKIQKSKFKPKFSIGIEGQEFKTEEKNLKEEKSHSKFRLFGIELQSETAEHKLPPLSSNKKPKAAPRGVATLSDWEQLSDGSVSGFISGSKVFSDGEYVTTSPVKNQAVGGTVVTTSSGSKYFLQI